MRLLSSLLSWGGSSARWQLCRAMHHAPQKLPCQVMTWVADNGSQGTAPRVRTRCFDCNTTALLKLSTPAYTFYYVICFELERLSLDNPSILDLYCQQCSLRALFREVSHTNDGITEGSDGDDQLPWGLFSPTGITVTRESCSTSMLLNKQ